MKKALLALTLVFGSLLGSAQTKVGYINTTDLVALMPQTDSVKKQLEKVRLQWMSELQRLENEYKTMVAEYNAIKDDPEVLQARKEIRQQALIDKEEDYRNAEARAQQDLAQKQQELFQPIIDMVLAAIEKVAKANGYDIVLDASEGYNVLYTNPEHDLMMKVRTELKVPEDAKPIDIDANLGGQ